MGKLLNGMYGPSTGTTGNITSYMLNGQNITRMKRTQRTHSSEKQLNNELRMKVLNNFFYSMKLYLKAGFSLIAKGTTKNYYNLAIAYNKKDALQGYYPDIVMDFPNVILSDGRLLPAENPMATRTVDGITFSWDNDSPLWENGADQTMLMAYFPTSETVECRLYGSKRSEGQELMTLQERLREEPAHVYIFFVSPDRSEVSKSSYLGEI